MNATRTPFFLAMAAALGLGACSSSDGFDSACYENAAACVDPTGAHNTYVINELILPTSAIEAGQMGLNVDANEGIDNAVGNIIQAISQIGPQIDVAQAFNDFLADGTWILLIDVQATDLRNASGAVGRMLPGINPAISPCTTEDDCGKHLVPGTQFDVDHSVPFKADIVGSIENGTLLAGPNKASIYIDLKDALPIAPFTLNAVGVKTETSTAPDSAHGVLAGGVHAEEFKDAVYPVFVAIVERDCTAGASPCCEADSPGEAILESLNIDDDCVMTEAELRQSSALEFAFRPDVDLLDATGAYNPGADGVLDSVSLGALFRAIPAQFEM